MITCACILIRLGMVNNIPITNDTIGVYKLLIQNGQHNWEMKMGINHLILQASLSLGEIGFTWQSAQLDLGPMSINVN